MTAGLDTELVKTMLLTLAYELPVVAVSFFALYLAMGAPRAVPGHSLARNGALLMVLLALAAMVARLARIQFVHGEPNAYATPLNNAINAFNVLAGLGWGAGLLMIVVAYRNALRSRPQPPPLP